MIKTLFKKDIYRNIEGVIKADNLSPDAIKQEVEEYVVTKELDRKLDIFFQEYAGSIGRPTQNVGVWISGFFGSGKSHLLKILSYILANRKLYEKPVGEIFMEKIEDFELKNNIEKAISIPCDTILFNIDQKADASAGAREKQLLEVFMKVFNEHRGYYAKFGYLAKFESDLDKQGLFEPFKEKFKEFAGISWEEGRETIFLEADNFAKALSAVKEISVENAEELIDRYEKNYALSIEDFASEVKAYIDTKPANYRLLFMVDEIGQYIGDNTDLMLNLQTIVETLATKCQGQAWVMVTSQEEIEALVGDQSMRVANDFSKILGRFAVKINLSSANANEVIQKRLLQKSDAAQSDLEALYAKIENHLRSKIRFTAGSAQYRGYESPQHFAAVYPFVPYQFDLLKSALRGLSRNSAFQGRHQSVGERSMLGVFQLVVQSVADAELGTLVTFDRFYDGLQTTIKGEIQSDINRASEHLDDPFALKVLKALFMVKYVKEFTANTDNITTLLIDRFDADIKTLRQKVQTALNTLEDQIYIQKVGDVYEFLTDSEKDMENEIKATEVEERQLTKELYEWIFDEIVGRSKVRDPRSGWDYPFSRKMDDHILKGHEEELGLNVITPLYPGDLNDERLVAKSIAETDVILYLGEDTTLRKDLELYLKTKIYIPKKHSVSLSATERALLAVKMEQNSKRRAQIIDRLREMMAEGRLFFNGTELNIPGSEAKNRIEKALLGAMETLFPSLSMLGRVYKEEDVKSIIYSADDLYSGSEETMSEAEKEMLSYIKRQKQQFKSPSVAALIEEFGKRPYGWYRAAVCGILASLYARQKIELREHAPLDKAEAAQALTKTNRFASTLVEPVKEVDTRKLAAVRDLFKELIPSLSLPTQPRDIYETVHRALMELENDLQGTRQRYEGYPFAKELDEAVVAVHKAAQLNADEFFDKILAMEDELLDVKEEIIDPIVTEFLKTDRFAIYEQIRRFVEVERDNLSELADPKVNDLLAIAADEHPYRGNKLVTARQSYEEVKAKLAEKLESVRSEALQKVDKTIERVQKAEGFDKLIQKSGVEQKHEVMTPLLALKSFIEQSGSILAIRQKVSELENLYLEALDRIDEFIAEESGGPQTAPKRVAIRELMPRYGRLKSREEVEMYLKELEKALFEAVEEGKEIVV